MRALYQQFDSCSLLLVTVVSGFMTASAITISIGQVRFRRTMMDKDLTQPFFFVYAVAQIVWNQKCQYAGCNLFDLWKLLQAPSRNKA